MTQQTHVKITCQNCDRQFYAKREDDFIFCISCERKLHASRSWPMSSCPCGDDCEKVLAECCGEYQNKCETMAYQDFRLCHIDEGCTTPKGGRTYE